MRQRPCLLSSLPEVLLEAICAKLQVEDVASLAVTVSAFAPLQFARMDMRLAAQRYLTETSHLHLAALIDKLPPCGAREQLTAMIENTMSAFKLKCA